MAAMRTRPLHRANARSPSPVNGGGTAFMTVATWFLPCEAGEGDRPKGGGGGVGLAKGGAGP
jgi:hypothetical protein